MNSLYGGFTAEQLDEYRAKLHNKLFWLLLYKDPETCNEFSDVDFDKYFINLMRELNGLCDILMHPSGIIEMMSVLQAAYNESCKADYDYKVYRKFVLDAHTLLDRMSWEVDE